MRRAFCALLAGVAGSTAACAGESWDPRCEAALGPGDLVITELFADARGDDTGREWIEIYNPTGATLDLRGAVLAVSLAGGAGRRTHVVGDYAVSSRSYAVLGGVLPELAPDFVDYGFGSDLKVGGRGLPNRGGRVAIECDQIVVDEVSYAAVTAGRALQLDGGFDPDHRGNDDPALWCDSNAPLGQEFATPGRANDLCPKVAPVQCWEESGPRALVSPQPGDLVISEYLARPQAVAASDGEWLEIAVLRSVDLNGLEIGRAEADGRPTDQRIALTSRVCLPAAAGKRLLVARNPVPRENGGLPPVDFAIDFGLVDRDDGLFVAFAGLPLDTITYRGLRPLGAAMSLDGDALTPDENDLEQRWCPAQALYGQGDRGTPGAKNPRCPLAPPPGHCLEDGQMRAIGLPAPGELVIAEYMARPAQVGAAHGEWFELRAEAAVDLNGLELGRAEPGLGPGPTLQRLASVTCLSLGPGERIVLARDLDPTTNGGVVADHPLSFALVDSDDGLFVSAAGRLVDVVTWTSSRQLGRSEQRDPAQPESFCTTAAESSLHYGANNYGTPGAPNRCL